MKLGNRELRGALMATALVVATAFVGCGDGSTSGSNEELGEVSQDWSVQSCATPGAHQTFQGAIPWQSSPPTYNACTKSYIVDVSAYDEPPSNTGGEGSTPTVAGNVTLEWGSGRPVTQAECEASYVGAIVYVRFGPIWHAITGQEKAMGQWRDGWCRNLALKLELLEDGRAYRIAATARTSTNTTVPFRFGTDL